MIIIILFCVSGLNIPLGMLYGHLAEVRYLLMIVGFVILIVFASLIKLHSFFGNYYHI